ncbi:MAG: hypothetical protein HYT89_01725 [Candidatus Omnitrophica bacterium]|nr:hypothetical protein [Candidatus Omnitrophota bacterium]
MHLFCRRLIRRRRFKNHRLSPFPEGEYQELKTTENTALAVSGGYVGIGKSTDQPATQSAKLDVEGYTSTNDVWLANPNSGSPRWVSDTGSTVPDCEICIQCGDANGHNGAISCEHFNSGLWAESRGESSDHGRGAACRTQVNCPPNGGIQSSW